MSTDDWLCGVISGWTLYGWRFDEPFDGVRVHLLWTIIRGYVLWCRVLEALQSRMKIGAEKLAEHILCRLYAACCLVRSYMTLCIWFQTQRSEWPEVVCGVPGAQQHTCSCALRASVFVWALLLKYRSWALPHVSRAFNHGNQGLRKLNRHFPYIRSNLDMCVEIVAVYRTMLQRLC